MKKLILITMIFVCGAISAAAQKPAEIKFDETTHHFGEFSQENAVLTCQFTFTNVGEEPLIINQAMASCGCTVAKYPKEPIMPGGKGSIDVKYNGVGKPLGPFRKDITVRSNGAVEITHLIIDGTMK